MADLFFVHSDDPGVVAAACSGVRTDFLRLAPDGLTDRVDGPGWSLITLRNAFTPYSVSRDSGGMAMVIGSTYDPRGPQVSDLLKPSPGERLQSMREYCRALNYGVALCVADGQVLVGADWLGMYPVYHFHSGSALVITSIPGLLRHVPGFESKLDIRGLVSLLLLAHTCLGRTLYEGVARLPSGRVLRYEGPERRTSLEDVPLGTPPSAPADLGEAVDAFDATLGTIVTGAIKELSPSIYLSGGLDTRILSGYLHRLYGGEPRAVTTGDRRDLEVRAAARLASAIGAHHEIVPVDQGRYPEYALKNIERDAMTCGLYVLAEWTVAESSRRPMFAGFLGESVMGSGHLGWGTEPSCDIPTFHAMFANASASGLGQGVISELVRADDVDDVLLDVWRGLKGEYDSYSGPRWQRTWWFDLFHRQRFMIGHLPKILALRSWPVLPYAQSAMVRLAAATPLTALSGRQVQMELIRRRFPELVKLPLVRGIEWRYYWIDPRKPSVWNRRTDRLKESLSWHLHRRFALPERRVFVRTFDFDGPGWKVLRDQARALADRVDPWLNRDLVLKLIPPSSVETRFKRLITDATGRKTLLGAVLQCSRMMEAGE